MILSQTSRNEHKKKIAYFYIPSFHEFVLDIARLEESRALQSLELGGLLNTKDLVE